MSASNITPRDRLVSVTYSDTNLGETIRSVSLHDFYLAAIGNSDHRGSDLIGNTALIQAVAKEVYRTLDETYCSKKIGWDDRIAMFFWNLLGIDSWLTEKVAGVVSAYLGQAGKGSELPLLKNEEIEEARLDHEKVEEQAAEIEEEAEEEYFYYEPVLQQPSVCPDIREGLPSNIFSHLAQLPRKARTRSAPPSPIGKSLISDQEPQRPQSTPVDLEALRQQMQLRREQDPQYNAMLASLERLPQVLPGLTNVATRGVDIQFPTPWNTVEAQE